MRWHRHGEVAQAGAGAPEAAFRARCLGLPQPPAGPGQSAAWAARVGPRWPATPAVVNTGTCSRCGGRGTSRAPVPRPARACTRGSTGSRASWRKGPVVKLHTRAKLSEGGLRQGLREIQPKKSQSESQAASRNVLFVTAVGSLWSVGDVARSWVIRRVSIVDKK